MIVICKECGRLLSVKCPSGHVYRPAQPLSTDLADWTQSAPTCTESRILGGLRIRCASPIDVRDVRRETCRDCIPVAMGIVAR
jgi:hypothetical protein